MKSGLLGTALLTLVSLSTLSACGQDSAWSVVRTRTTESFRTITSSSERFAIAGGVSETFHWDGERWRPYESSPLGIREVRMGHGETWGVSIYSTYRLRGERWLEVETPGTLEPWEVRPLSDGEALALTSGVHRWDGAEWRLAPAPDTNHGHFMWAASADEYFIAEKRTSGGVERVFWVKDGASTEVTPVGVGESLAWIGLEGVGTTPWLFGSLGGDVIDRVFRWTGAGWATVEVGDEILRDLHPLDAETAVAVGDKGGIVRLTAAGPVLWRTPDDKSSHLLTVGGSGPEDLWAAGEDGFILRFDPSFED